MLAIAPGQHNTWCLASSWLQIAAGPGPAKADASCEACVDVNASPGIHRTRAGSASPRMGAQMPGNNLCKASAMHSSLRSSPDPSTPQGRCMSATPPSSGTPDVFTRLYNGAQQRNARAEARQGDAEASGNCGGRPQALSTSPVRPCSPASAATPLAHTAMLPVQPLLHLQDIGDCGLTTKPRWRHRPPAGHASAPCESHQLRLRELWRIPLYRGPLPTGAPPAHRGARCAGARSG
jgi:hypothetical protein